MKPKKLKKLLHDIIKTLSLFLRKSSYLFLPFWYKNKSSRIHAIPLSSRRRAIIKNMTKMCATLAALNFNPCV